MAQRDQTEVKSRDIRQAENNMRVMSLITRWGDQTGEVKQCEITELQQNEMKGKKHKISDRDRSDSKTDLIVTSQMKRIQTQCESDLVSKD